MDKEIRIVGLTGSLRRNPYNTAALRATQMLLPDKVRQSISLIG